MRKPITKMHSLRRTSPKGQSFIGVCFQCGKEMSLEESMKSWCENTVGLTKDEALLVTLEEKL